MVKTSFVWVPVAPFEMVAVVPLPTAKMIVPAGMSPRASVIAAPTSVWVKFPSAALIEVLEFVCPSLLVWRGGPGQSERMPTPGANRFTHDP
jgi:hypothetical protein